jgi:hypothetical protein
MGKKRRKMNVTCRIKDLLRIIPYYSPLSWAYMFMAMTETATASITSQMQVYALL